MPTVTRLGVRKAATSVSQPPIDREEVARIAYALFEQRGRVHGHDQQDWFEALRMVQQHRRNGNGR